MIKRALAFRLGILVVGLVPALGLGGWMAADRRPAESFEIGLDLLARGRADDAAYLFDDPAWQGVAHYRAGRFHHAASGFGQGQDIAAIYNLGVANARQYNWQNAIAAFEETLRRQSDHADARHNLAVVKQAKLAEEQQKEASRRTVQYGKSQQNSVPDPDSEADQADGKEGNASSQPSLSKPAEKLPSDTDVTPASGLDGLAGNDTLAGAQAAAATDPDDIIRDGDPTIDGKSGYRRQNPSSVQAGAVLLGQIKDDPARVLRSRLHTAWTRRQAFIKP